MILPENAGIVDTGTTLLLLATDVFQQYVQLTGATLDATTGLLTLPASQFGTLQSLFFSISSVRYAMTQYHVVH